MSACNVVGVIYRCAFVYLSHAMKVKFQLPCVNTVSITDLLAYVSAQA